MNVRLRWSPWRRISPSSESQLYYFSKDRKLVSIEWTNDLKLENFLENESEKSIEILRNPIYSHALNKIRK